MNAPDPAAVLRRGAPGMAALRRRPIRTLVAAAIVIAIGLRLTGLNPAVAQAPELIAYHSAVDPGADLAGDAWSRIPGVELTLTVQQVVYPIIGTGTPVVVARAIHTEDRLYIGLQWQDQTLDESSRAVEDFTDAAAVQFPGVAASTVPFVCMGQADQAVNIWYWRADNQVGAPDWRAPHVPDGYVDEYPSTADLYFPAREAGNLTAQAGGGAQNLVAGGFGMLSPADQQVVMGQGHYEDGRWSVVFARASEPPGPNQPTFDGRTPTDIAFAVWNGSNDERNGKKSVSQFAVLDYSSEEAPGPALGLAVGPPMIALLNVLIFGWLRLNRRRHPDAVISGPSDGVS